MCIMVSKQKMDCFLSLSLSGFVRALTACLIGLSTSVQANSCAHTCTTYISHEILQRLLKHVAEVCQHSQVLWQDLQSTSVHLILNCELFHKRKWNYRAPDVWLQHARTYVAKAEGWDYALYIIRMRLVWTTDMQFEQLNGKIAHD